MRWESQGIVTDAVDDLVKALPRPAKDTFLVAFNQHETHQGERLAGNPLRRFFSLLDGIADNDRRVESAENKRNWNAVKAEAERFGRVPEINGELEAEIACVLEDFKTVLPPEHHAILERTKVRKLFALARSLDRDVRQIDANRTREVQERRNQQIERHRRMVELARGRKP